MQSDKSALEDVMIWAFLISLALLDAWAIRAVLRDKSSSQDIHMAQIAFVLLVPMLGALLTLLSTRGKPAPAGTRRREAPEGAYGLADRSPNPVQPGSGSASDGGGSGEGGGSRD
jgi:uncharacterized membrane protein YgcG